MTRFLRTFAALIALGLSLVACGEVARQTASAPPSVSPSTASPTPNASVDPSALRYTCGTFPFGSEILTVGPGTAEAAANPAAAALRARLARTDEDVALLPDTGWHLAGMDSQKAEFVAAGGESGMWVAVVENGAAGWTVSGWGDCQARVVVADGLVVARWILDPAKPKPGPTTQTVDAMVTEQSCASGKPGIGRIVGPEIVRTADSVLVIFATRPLPGAQDCPGNPAARVTVDLGEPLGARKLLDGSSLPPKEPVEPPCCGG